ncbi:hypothetical protein GOP47_0005715 [Adiantum capillus-veneris]|uniref:Uncharacterized protein n=1 Tax=Adiantum capillus-veneris TaxID=13818 RepID=A0A9D4V5K7_ADICA|nr:hypothetical protein GOP47_0005715 [Adiantum capillus-veneris]
MLAQKGRFSIMDNFEAPSFSLGLDEEVTPSPHGHAAVLHASNPFKIGIHSGTNNLTYKDEENMQSLNRGSNPDYDSDFELLPPSSTPRIVKRLQRKSGHSVLAPSNPSQNLQHAGGTNTSKESLPLNLSKLKKTCLPKKTSMPTMAGSNGRTLPNFWKGLDSKLVKGSPATFCSKGGGESVVGPTGLNLHESREFLTRINEMQLDTSQLSEFVIPGIIGKRSPQLAVNHKAGLQKGCVGLEKDDSSKVQVDLKDNYTCSVHDLSSKTINNRLAIENDRPSLASPLFENGGNSLHDQKSSLCGSSFTCQNDDLAKTCRKSIDDNKSNGLDEPPLQSPWRSSAHRIEKLHSPSPSKQQPLDCPTKAHIGKTTNANFSQSKTNALQSFWKSLNEQKSSTCETVDGAEEDDIENCSTDDDFEFSTQPTRKLSLCGNKSVRTSASFLNVAADCTPHQSFNQLLSSTSASPNNSFIFRHSPKSSLVEERGNLCSTSKTAACSSSVKLGTSQSFAPIDTAQMSSTQCLDDFGTKQKLSLNKILETASIRNIMWQCSDDDKEDNSLVSHAIDNDHCETSTRAYQANPNVFGDKSNYFVDFVSKEDPKVANLLRLRLPHFLSVSALRQDEFAGMEPVYIDYENQFSGGKAGSCPLASMTLKQQSAARSTSKWRKIAQRNQKSVTTDNDGWIQTGNKKPASRRKNRQSGGDRGSQTPVSTNAKSSAGPGHWVTERTGKRIYITRDGRTLSGSSAYNQHIKDSGKRLKKTKRRRPRTKKQKLSI